MNKTILTLGIMASLLGIVVLFSIGKELPEIEEINPFCELIVIKDSEGKSHPCHFCEGEGIGCVDGFEIKKTRCIGRDRYGECHVFKEIESPTKIGGEESE